MNLFLHPVVFGEPLFIIVDFFEVTVHLYQDIQGVRVVLKNFAGLYIRENIIQPEGSPVDMISCWPSMTVRAEKTILILMFECKFVPAFTVMIT
jgi:hypothetical protein